jgi:hypothetical protein
MRSRTRSAHGALDPVLSQGSSPSGSDALDPEDARFPRGKPRGIHKASVNNKRYAASPGKDY